ncbi:citramalate synthase [Candidatus Woesearchaeota archaeon CG1_02_57_44]|nr:MAG: citramalate synthase [Candidatus Woesearchaeota archaeon CG1_02_57_44]
MVQIAVYDTTLRDGAQSPHVRFGIKDKLTLLRMLDDYGIDYVELGYPAASEAEMKVFQEGSKLNLATNIVAFGSTHRMGVAAKDDIGMHALVKSGAKVACIFGKARPSHVSLQLKASLDDNLAAIADSVSYLKSQGMTVFFDAEHFFDGCGEDKAYAFSCLNVAADAGAHTLILCDTSGGAMPPDVELLTREAVKAFPGTVIGIHCHNDCGLGVANTMAAVRAGASHVQGTINGFGERTGNADLCQVLPLLGLKLGCALGTRVCKPGIKLSKTKSVSDRIFSLANVKPDKSKPFVGDYAFMHKAGMHVDAIRKGASYEHIAPAAVGNDTYFVLSELSGKANVLALLEKHGIVVDKQDPRVKALLMDVERMEAEGYGISGLPAEHELLIAKHFKALPFQLDSWRIVTEHMHGEFSECMMTGVLDGAKIEAFVSLDDNGPVDAMFVALKKLLAKYPVRGISLINYKVMIAQDKGPESSVRVYIEFKDNGHEWATAGVSTNILEASIEALTKGFTYHLHRKQSNVST